MAGGAKGPKRRNDASRRRLSFEQANAICRRFVPIGDNLFTYIERLKEANFSAFVPYHEFLDSFASCPEDLRVHRRYQIELAKLRLGRPHPMRRSSATWRQVFFSPFIQHLREERDRANGVPETELSRRYPWGEAAWRREIDPCERNKVYASVNDEEFYEARWNAMLEERRQRLVAEVPIHATGLAKDYNLSKKGRYSFFTAAMKRDAAKLGFHYDAGKSYPDFPVFSKPINDDWDLCWAIEEPEFFFMDPMSGSFDPYLELRHKKLSGSIGKAKVGDFLHIEYNHIVIGFGNAYWQFYDLDELETVVRAHLFFYSLIAPIIETVLQDGLDRT